MDTKLSGIVLIAMTFAVVALVMLLKEMFRDKEPVFTHEELATAAGRGEDVVLNPDQCACLVREYRRALMRGQE